ARHDPLVAVTAGHLVARLDLALHSDEDLDHLHDARRHFVAALDLFDLVHEALFEARLGFVVLAAEGFDLALNLLVLDGEHPPLRAGIFGDDGVRQLGALLEGLRAGDGDVAAQHVDQTAVDVTVEDRLLVVTVLARRSISSRSIAIARSSFSTPWRLKTRTSTTVPKVPGGMRMEVSRTSEAFSPKMARRSFSSGVIGLSPFGVILPTRMSPG
ncbi:hypothetical protein BVRB_026110, partial [Beta vulgaris subsp. vulgaris]